MRGCARIWTAALALLFSQAVLAHEGHAHVLGTLVAVNASYVDVRGSDEKVARIVLVKETRYLLRGVAVPASALKIGSRVVIDADRKGETLEAREVRFVVA
jgi:hypothetical protein